MTAAIALPAIIDSLKTVVLALEHHAASWTSINVAAEHPMVSLSAMCCRGTLRRRKSTSLQADVASVTLGSIFAELQAASWRQQASSELRTPALRFG
jgi:hypothetical protein